MQIIPTVAPILDGEDFTSWINHLSRLNNMSTKDFIKAFLFQDFSHKFTDSYIRDLSHIYDNYVGDGFPTPKELLFNHYDIFARLFFKNFTFSSCCIQSLLDTTTFPNYERTLSRTLRYCPICSEEDLDQHGRVIAHALHQTPYLTICPTHHVHLIDASGRPISNKVTVTADDISIANFVNDIYSTKNIGNLDLIIPKIRQIGLNTICDNDVLMSDYHKFNLNGQYYGLNNKSMISMVLRLFNINELIYVQDEQKIHSDVMTILNTYIPTLHIIRWDYPLVQFACDKCESSFWMYVHYFLQFPVCPTCRSLLNRSAQINCLIGAKTRGQFQLAESTPRSISIKHTCGNITKKHFPACLYYSSIECPICDKKIIKEKHNATVKREPHVGDTGLMNGHRKATIISCIDPNDLSVVFENGSRRDHVTFNNFQSGHISPPLKNRTERVGERKMMNCGLTATIINYRKERDIDIQFENGIIRSHVQYHNFCSGQIRCPKE